jgi:hypothetical protein
VDVGKIPSRLSGLLIVGAVLGAIGIGLAVPAPPPSAAAATGTWTATYFNNMTLSGHPALERGEGADLDMFLHGEAPGPGVNVEQFSATWIRSDDYAAGMYRITATADGGIAVFVDGNVVLDEWFDQEATTYTTDIELSAGTHELGVDYYNNLDKAVAHVRIEVLELHEEPTAVAASTQVPAATGTAPPATRTIAITRTVRATMTSSIPQHTKTVSVTTAYPAAPTTTPQPSSTPGPPPRIGCLWALPDMDSRAPGMQYDTEPASGTHDDDGQLAPDGDNNASNGVQAPCSGPANSPPAQLDGVRHLMQVAPNLEDEPERRGVQLWADIGASGYLEEPAVFWFVYHPDGSAVGGVGSTRVPPDGCTSLGGPSASATMFEAAVANGEVAADAVSDPGQGMVALCQNDQTRVFHGEFELSKDQPCGEYGVVVTAVSADGAISTLGASFDVVCAIGLRVDFNAVDWGSLSPGQGKAINGDLTFAPPDSVAPTVKNAGNDGMGLKLRFGPMTGLLSQTIIGTFGACFGRTASLLQCVDPISMNTTATFDPDSQRTLCANETGELDLSVHPPIDAPEDEFGGVLTIIGYHVPARCAGNRHLP